MGSADPGEQRTLGWVLPFLVSILFPLGFSSSRRKPRTTLGTGIVQGASSAGSSVPDAPMREPQSIIAVGSAASLSISGEGQDVPHAPSWLNTGPCGSQSQATTLLPSISAAPNPCFHVTNDPASTPLSLEKPKKTTLERCLPPGSAFAPLLCVVAHPLVMSPSREHP